MFKFKICLGAAAGVLLTTLFALPAFLQSDLRNIVQTDTKITVDGQLEDWEGIASYPISLQVSGQEIDPSEDIAVAAHFTFDSKRFYAALQVKDDILKFPSRSWRYGDGFLLTFLDPHLGDQSDRFITFGFSMVKDKPEKVLLNINGTYFPPESLKDVDFEIVADEKQGTLFYEIAIPFTFLTPFRPFLQDLWGINLTYADGDNTDRTILQLFPDPAYDSETTKVRRAEIFKFVAKPKERPEVQGVMQASHYYDDAEKKLILGINSTGQAGEWTLRYNLSSPKVNLSGTEKLDVPQGKYRVEWILPAQEFTSDDYVLSVGLIDTQGSLRFTQDNRFFVLNRAEIEGMKDDQAQALENDTFTENERFRTSLPSVEIRWKWLHDFMEKAAPFESMVTLHQWYVDQKYLIEQITEGKPALFLPGRLGRLAHRSKLDDSLQPYSLYVPDYYKEEEALPLFVTLHGSGVDEQQSIRHIAQTLFDFRFVGKAGRMLVLAPQGRGLSDWYVGDAEIDVLECIDHVKSLYNIDEKRIILDGFSMGGYGSWRLGLLYPEIFKAVVIRSGAVAPPPPVPGENIIDLMRSDLPNSYFVVHGAKDQAVSVENARSAVQKMQALGLDYKYLEIKDAAHGGYDKWDDILSWLGKKVDWKLVAPTLKSPQKRR